MRHEAEHPRRSRLHDGGRGKTAGRRLNKAALDDVVYAPLGSYLRHFAWRKSVTGIAKGPGPFFWGVSKTA